MPTGYTANVADGKVTDFPTFAMQCARAFGACIEMRDDPTDTPIPDEFKPSDYHAEALAAAQQRLAEFKARDGKAWNAATEQHNAEAMKQYQEDIARNERIKDNYLAMLAQVQAWEPPSPDHHEMKKFMELQLYDSIKFDCRIPEKPRQLTVAEFMELERESIAWDISYHTKQQAEEVERAKSRTQWVRQLRESLQTVTA